MKKLVVIYMLTLLTVPVLSQNIQEALQLKAEWFGVYPQPEITTSDTIIDLKNGYFEASSPIDIDKKFITKQAAIFSNSDGTTTLGITRVEYDFVCFEYFTEFFEIDETGESVVLLDNINLLPEITIRELVTDTLHEIIGKYLPEVQDYYKDPEFSMERFLDQFYHIVYYQPRVGINLKASLGVCDYSEVDISQEDWDIIENEFITIELQYNKKMKTFKRLSDE